MTEANKAAEQATKLMAEANKAKDRTDKLKDKILPLDEYLKSIQNAKNTKD